MPTTVMSVAAGVMPRTLSTGARSRSIRSMTLSRRSTRIRAIRARTMTKMRTRFLT